MEMIFVGVNPAFLKAVLMDPGEQVPFSSHPFVDASEYRISPLVCSVNTRFWIGSRTKLSTPSLAIDQLRSLSAVIKGLTSYGKERARDT